ncbi:hypothetical protein SS05631_c06900 [Sinorhizobium sp. CCBAU 05631]|nr:hypothetical protein SS05631_c06900 [Sinorhizobium sp. CCBAU 05631]
MALSFFEAAVVPHLRSNAVKTFAAIRSPSGEPCSRIGLFGEIYN